MTCYRYYAKQSEECVLLQLETFGSKWLYQNIVFQACALQFYLKYFFFQNVQVCIVGIAVLYTHVYINVAALFSCIHSSHAIPDSLF